MFSYYIDPTFIPMPNFARDPSSIAFGIISSIESLPQLSMIMHRKSREPLCGHHFYNLLRKIFFLFSFFDDDVLFIYRFSQRGITFDKLDDTIRLAFMICCFRDEQYTIGIMRM